MLAPLHPAPAWRFRITRDMTNDWSRRDDEKLRRYDQWLAYYEEVHPQNATCRFVEYMGARNVASGFEDLIQLHDDKTQAMSDLPLA